MAGGPGVGADAIPGPLYAILPRWGYPTCACTALLRRGLLPLATARLEDSATEAVIVAGGSADGATMSESEPPLRHWRGLTLALLGGVFAVHFLDRQILAILIPPIKAELGLSDTALGFLSGFAFTIFFSTVGLVIARLADRADRARIITWSLAVFSVMTAICGFATGFWQLLAARVGVGVGEGGTNPASHSLIADLFPMRERAAAMATYSIGPHIGLVLAFGLGGWLGQMVGWRSTFIIVGAIGLALALITRIGLRDPQTTIRHSHATQGPSASEVVHSLLRSRVLRHLFAGATLATAAALGLVTWLPALLTRVHGMSLTQAGVFLALAFGVAGAAGTYLFGRIADTVSIADASRKPRIVAGCQLLLAALWLAALLVEDRGIALTMFIISCVLIGAYVGPTLALVQDVVDPRARAFSAAILLLVVNFVGASLGPLAVGMLSDALAASAGPQSLRYALLATPALLVWSGLHYARATNGLARELRE
jgi:predicted MFS family arabinose efflux permease